MPTPPIQRDRLRNLITSLEAVQTVLLELGDAQSKFDADQDALNTSYDPIIDPDALAPKRIRPLDDHAVRTAYQKYCKLIDPARDAFGGAEIWLFDSLQRYLSTPAPLWQMKSLRCVAFVENVPQAYEIEAELKNLRSTLALLKLVERNYQNAEQLGNQLAVADDFSWIRCEKGEFTFTTNQRPVIKALLADLEKGGLGLSQSHLLQLAGGSSNELRDLFKDHPAWKVVVVQSARKDMFKLALCNDRPKS